LFFCPSPVCRCLFNHPATSEIYTLSLHDALPISIFHGGMYLIGVPKAEKVQYVTVSYPEVTDGEKKITDWEQIRLAVQLTGFLRSEEHTSELQSRFDLVCRLLLEKKKLKQQHMGS